MKNKRTTVKVLLFLCYWVLLCVLLFARDPYDHTRPYWSVISENYNIVPFRMIRDMLQYVRRRRSSYLYYYGLINLIGNFFLFAPMGFFLPWLSKGIRKLNRTIPLVMLIVIALELIQLFTLRGFADVDDLILNTAGAVLGYMAFKLLNGADLIK